MARASTLRITHRPGEGNTHRVTVSLIVESATPLEFSCAFNFVLPAEDRERIQWYLETYLAYQEDPAPALAKQAERLIIDVGKRLFAAVFEHDRDALRLWARLEPLLPETRIEIVSEREAGWLLPWELLRDGLTNDSLAVRAKELVRSHPNPIRPFKLPQVSQPPVRVLLVICRPGRDDDVPFQSVARKLISALGQQKDFKLDVLRPPTFDALAERLRQAKAAGLPYHVIHFDGHGVFLDIQQIFKQWEDKTIDKDQDWLVSLLEFDRQRYTPNLLYPGTVRPGSHGYLVFENPHSEYNTRLVDGPDLGALLSETEVPILILNACRSARAADVGNDEQTNSPGQEMNRHERVRAFGSLAQEVMDAGVPGVLAMHYNVYVVTAAEFVGNLYMHLAEGQTFGAAASASRKHLKANPFRAIGYDPIKLEDWMVPVVYEASPLRLAPEKAQDHLRITVKTAEETPVRGAGVDLPRPPDYGFFGRDETLLALDRVFDTHQIVLLQGYAGSGKTTTVAEFARWYRLTGGVDGLLLFTTFERYLPLPRVLDTFERIFESVLEKAGIHWLTLDDEQRRAVAIQVLQQTPVLWIWDNVEPVAGFPAGTQSDWSIMEQEGLRDFLYDLKNTTKAKVLLTSRRDEAEWLGDLPVRIKIPPMPMQERVQLAQAIAEKHGRRLGKVANWRSLLRFTQGNPLTINVLVGQALRDRLRTKEQIDTFVAKLRAGEAAFDDEESEGRTKSLGASLSYGYEHAFNDVERRQLALLHLFQGVVDVDSLVKMGDPKEDWCLPEVRRLTRVKGMKLLDRAAGVGLLTTTGSPGYYIIHPALPWYFKKQFVGIYRGRELEAIRAFVDAIRFWGTYYHYLYSNGKRHVIDALIMEEDNLLYARRLAHTHGWWDKLVSTMQGLDHLYEHTGRRAVWRQLVDEIVPDFCNPDTDGPVSGLEEQWSLVTEYRVYLAQEARQLAEAERLQSAKVEWSRQWAASALTVPEGRLDFIQHNRLRTLAVSLSTLGDIQFEQNKGECVSLLEEAWELLNRIGDRSYEAIVALNLGNAYWNLSDIRNIAQAEYWYRRSLELRDENDRIGRAKCYVPLGGLARARFLEAWKADRSEEALQYFNDAMHFYYQALDLLPSDAIPDLGVVHQHLGTIYGDIYDLDRALTHYRKSIRYYEATGDIHGAALTRFNVAVDLAKARRFVDSLAYANAALRNLQSYGTQAVTEIEKIRQLIVRIEQYLKAQSG